MNEEMIAAEAEVNRAEWLKKNGFNENHETYVYYPDDAYHIKETLKDAGFIFTRQLFWHISSIPEGYEDKVILIKLEDVAEGSAWGDYRYKGRIKDKVLDAMRQARPHIDSQWIGEIGERLKDLFVTLVQIHPFMSMYGPSQVVKFQTEEGNLLIWFTTVDLTDYEVGDSLLLNGTVKDHSEDKYSDDTMITVLTRCKLKVA